MGMKNFTHFLPMMKEICENRPIAGLEIEMIKSNTPGYDAINAINW